MLKIIVICGPTAVGKTKLAAVLCKDFDGEIISADSQQVYRGMDIGTAKEMPAGSGVACHLIDVVRPDEPFDAAKFAALGQEAISDIVRRGKVPFVVGGTGFYIKALIDGLPLAPGRAGIIRKELIDIKERDGSRALYEILKVEDPSMAGRLNPNDFQRIIRAIEVKRLTGRSLASFKMKPQNSLRYLPLKIGLTVDRALLYERINARVDKMIEDGLVAEVEEIVSRYGTDIQPLKAVGYKEIASYLSGNMTLDRAVALTKQNTRRFAKRQLTWFRRDPDIEWHSPDDYDGIRKVIHRWIMSR